MKPPAAAAASPPGEEDPSSSPCFDHALGCVVGAMVGDAAGGPLEFLRRMPTAGEVQSALKMPGGGVWRLGPGQITDDTELALSMAHALAGADPRVPRSPTTGPPPLDEIARWYGRWLASPPFDIGITTSNALSASEGVDLDGPVPGLAAAMVASAKKLNAESLSNGALMRVSPLAVWACRHTEEQIVNAARLEAALTHSNPIAQDANAAYVVALVHLINKPGDAPGAIAAAEAWAARGPAAVEVQQWLAEAAAPGPGPAVHAQAGFVRWGFVHAFRALHQRLGFEEGLAQILALGGDVDTNACIVGAMLGALHGASAIPEALRGPVLSRKEDAPGRRRPAFLTGSVAEPLVRRLWAAATGVAAAAESGSSG